MTVAIKKVGVIGAGQMGNGIAHVARWPAIDVVLDDMSGRPAEIGAGDHQRQPGAPGRQEDHHRGRAKPAARRASARRQTLDDLGGLRSGDRGRGREGRRQAQDLPRPLRGAEAGSDPRHQHLVDLDHAAGRLDRPAGAFHRHSFHESGAGDGAGGSDPRHRHRRRDLRGRARNSSPSSARRSPCRKISRPSSSTASCCR